jgi:hypothetical protein
VRESIDLITAGHARPISDQPIRPSRRLTAIIEKAMHVYPDQRFADLRELGRALAAASGRRGRWPWSATPELGVARISSAKPPRRTRLDSEERTRRGLTWAIGATVIGCSIGAPFVAWSVRRQRIEAPLSVTTPLVASENAVPVVTPPAPIPCAAPCPLPASERRLPALGAPAPAPPLSALAPAAPPALVNAATSEPEPVAAHEAAVAPELEPAAASPAPASFTEVGGAGDTPPQGEVSQTTLPLPATAEGDALDYGVSPEADAAAPTIQEPVDDASPTVTAAPTRPERGTNGAFIFD